MEAHQILKKAWDAVMAAGLPESMQEAAFREAVALVREEHGLATAGDDSRRPGRNPTRKAAAKTAKVARPKKDDADEAAGTLPDEAGFFSELAHESGVSETDLRDILSFGSTGEVHVTPATRVLGANRAEQARTVTSLIVAARGIGLRESPVAAAAVRKEVDRKRCLDSANYASKVIGRLGGVNYGGDRSQLVLTSKWVSEFEAAVKQAHGRASDPNQE